MIILSLDAGIVAYLNKHGLTDKFNKQCSIFERNPFHPGLHTELLNPKHMRVWSFRVDRKYRAIFIFHNKTAVEILDVNNHYK